MPLVSVIVPNFNHAAFLNQRLESIFNQTFQDFEVILLDDNSSDSSTEILEKFAVNPKVTHYIVNEINSGSPFKQWKKGIDLASGEFIWIAESDDWCEAKFLETIVDEMILHTDLVLGFVQSYSIKDTNEIIWISKHDKLNDIVEGPDFVRKNLLYGNAIFNASMAVFRKKVADEITDEFLDYKFCGDWIFWAEIAFKGNVFISGKTINYFRNHDSDVSSKAYNNGYNFIEEFNLLGYFLKQGFINESDYKSALKTKYVRYRNAAPKLQDSVKVKINHLFNSSENNLVNKYSLVVYYNKEMTLRYLKAVFKKLFA